MAKREKDKEKLLYHIGEIMNGFVSTSIVLFLVFKWICIKTYEFFVWTGNLIFNKNKKWIKDKKHTISTAVDVKKPIKLIINTLKCVKIVVKEITALIKNIEKIKDIEKE